MARQKSYGTREHKDFASETKTETETRQTSLKEYGFGFENPNAVFEIEVSCKKSKLQEEKTKVEPETPFVPRDNAVFDILAECIKIGAQAAT